ncbi:MAG TPA: hypothetical protein OIM59_05595 [Bacteroides mediterraneensis]|nr:hypothetical protein [Bacteroides mediterraneensis]HJH64102.1 hypothetical protein [Bacteroides mediterraneensis]
MSKHSENLNDVIARMPYHKKETQEELLELKRRKPATGADYNI